MTYINIEVAKGGFILEYTQQTIVDTAGCPSSVSSFTREREVFQSDRKLMARVKELLGSATETKDSE